MCDERFSAVREALAESLDDDVGASAAVYLDGELVADLWDGFADAARTIAWERDTITCVWSTTKTMLALCALILADRGDLDLAAPVARYWPEFAAAGKDRALVRHLLAHTAGLPDFGCPQAELKAVCDLEGKVIKACPQGVKGIATTARMIAQAEQEAAVLMQQQDPGVPASPGATANSLTNSKPSTRSCQSALALMSRTVSAACCARSNVGIAPQQVGRKAHHAKLARLGRCQNGTQWASSPWRAEGSSRPERMRQNWTASRVWAWGVVVPPDVYVPPAGPVRLSVNALWCRRAQSATTSAMIRPSWPALSTSSVPVARQMSTRCIQQSRV